MIRILLVDDQNLVQQGIKSILAQDPELKIVGTLKDGRSAVTKIAELTPDIVLLDIEMPGMDGITATKYITHLSPQTKVIILSSHEDKKYLTQALMAGAKAYLLKDSLIADLKQSIFAVNNGYSQIESRLLAKIFDPSQIKQRNKSPKRSQNVAVQTKTTQVIESTLTDSVVISRPERKIREASVSRIKTSSPVPKINLAEVNSLLEPTFEGKTQSSTEPREKDDHRTNSADLPNRLLPALMVQDSRLKLSTTEPEHFASKAVEVWQTKIEPFQPLISRWQSQLTQIKSELLELLKRSLKNEALTNAGLIALGFITVIIIHQIFS